MTLRRFDRGELETFLRAVDRYLTSPTKIVIIGGTAASLAHGIDATTVDIDLFQSDSIELQRAANLACEETGLDVPICDSTVADIPYNAEDRLVRHLGDLPHLEVWALEKHDLVLSKILRWADSDRYQVRQLRDLSLDVLVERFTGEMTHVVGDHGRFKENFLDLVQDLFGELEQVRLRRSLRGWENR